MSAALYLPATRVTVIGKDGSRRPWTPPPPESKAPERPAPIAVGYVKDPAIPASFDKPKARSGRQGRAESVLAIAPNGYITPYRSVEAAAKATGVCGAQIRRQCRGLARARLMAYSFRFAGGIR
jgi:hypothetical protein